MNIQIWNPVISNASGDDTRKSPKKKRKKGKRESIFFLLKQTINPRGDTSVFTKLLIFFFPLPPLFLIPGLKRKKPFVFAQTKKEGKNPPPLAQRLMSLPAK